jgi:hypothetical protein
VHTIAHIEGRDLEDRIASIMDGVLPATPDDGPSDPARVRAALGRLADLQAQLEPGSPEWAAVGDYAESLVPLSW